MPPRKMDERTRELELGRALPKIMNGHRVLEDGSLVCGVMEWNVDRFAEYEPHGTSLLNFMVNVRVLSAKLVPGIVVTLINVKQVHN